MSILRRSLLLLSLLLGFSVLIFVSNSEAARSKGKKLEAPHKRKHVAVKKQQRTAVKKQQLTAVKKQQPTPTISARVEPRPRPVQLEEEYLVSELEPQDNAVLQKAFGLLGIKYRFGGTNYTGIDCSAFVKRVFAALSLSLPRTAREQYAVGKEVPAGELQKGDLLFYHTYAGFPSHVGIYIGNDLMIHASSEGGTVMVSRIDTPYFLSRFIGARRVSSDGGGFLHELAGEKEPVLASS
jgi:cell wall-associated NlpC family hydrolase